MIDFAKIINQIRKEKKITLVELAQSIGVTYQGLQQMLKLNDFRISQLEKIAKALDIEMKVYFDKLCSVCSVCNSILDVEFVKITDCNLCKNCRDELSNSFKLAMSMDRSDYPEL